MSQIKDIEKTWQTAMKKGAEKWKEKCIVKDGVAYPVEDETSVMEKYISQFSVSALKALCRICEDPGQTKTEYSKGSKTVFNEIKTLIDKGLVEEKREPYARHAGLFPTEEGRDIYIGFWYAHGKGHLVPRMQAADMLIPFTFYDCRTYRLRYDQSSLFTLVDAETDRTFPVSNLYISPDWNIYFDITGSGQRFSADVEEDFDLDDKMTRDCLIDIAKHSKERHFKNATRDYEGLISDLLDESE